MVASHVWFASLTSSLLLAGLEGQAADTPAATAPVRAATPRPSATLDLRPPTLAELYSPAQLDRLIQSMRDPQRDELERVEVEAARNRARSAPRSPVVPGGLLAPLWALAHPTQAWRVLAPLPDDQARHIGVTAPRTSDTYRPVPKYP